MRIFTVQLRAVRSYPSAVQDEPSPISDHASGPEVPQRFLMAAQADDFRAAKPTLGQHVSGVGKLRFNYSPGLPV
ncbi:ribosomal RNA large subunit methyltransferase J [Rhodovulum sulfidophilum]|uniref:Ribosomal RNA large subunit methyltransferase J n=1 Tax=Rhodovulum sulfidophilum TaxID=35806 RepID=A0A0D6AYR0_RHOSU|nr:ribosomal RNA large subunit methyltransferase J [Rhodovulum sulfidophilum]